MTDKPPKKSHKKKAASGADSLKAAQGLMEMIELFAVPMFGPDAAFNKMERFFIESPLSHLIEKYGDLSEKFGGLIDPIMVIAGGVAYGSRIAKLDRVTYPEHYEPPVSPTPSPNGHKAANQAPYVSNMDDMLSGFGVGRT